MRLQIEPLKGAPEVSGRVYPSTGFPVEESISHCNISDSSPLICNSTVGKLREQ